MSVALVVEDQSSYIFVPVVVRANAYFSHAIR
jgi:hypothetical protein